MAQSALGAVVVMALATVASDLQGQNFTREMTTYLGGDSTDTLNSVLDGGDGHLYVTGVTRSSTFLGMPTNSGGFALFALKIDPSGSGSVVAQNLVPGPELSVTLTGTSALSATHLYVAGNTNDAGFLQNVPTGAAYDSTFNGGRDLVVVAFDRDTLVPVAGTYLGGSSRDVVDAITVGPDGRVYILGRTQTAPGSPIEFPTTPGAFDETVNCSKGQCDVDFTVSVLSADLSTLEYSTVFGGTGVDFAGFSGTLTGSAQTIAVDGNGRIIFTGSTESKDFPVTDGSVIDGRQDAVLVILDPRGQGPLDLVRSAYIGGRSAESGLAVELDPSGAIWIAGETASNDFPGASGHMGQEDGFLSLVVESGAGAFALQSTTLLGGGSVDSITDVEIDAGGDLLVTGITRSTDFPASADADDASHNGGDDAFLARIAATGGVVHATLFGGSRDDRGSTVAITTGNLVHVGGSTESLALPTTPGAIQETYGGSDKDGFLSSYSVTPPAVCGDGVCSPGEDSCSCPADCGPAPDADLDGIDACSDCDDNDPLVHPGAAEICGDGIDNNCDGLTDCEDDFACGSDPACQAPPCELGQEGDPCKNDGDCCSGNCQGKGRDKSCGPDSGKSLRTGSTPALFVRGDANRDAAVDVSDALATLGWLFLPAPELTCLDAADANDDGAVDLSDAVHTLSHLFTDSEPLAEPWPDHGSDPTRDALGCKR